MRALRTAVGWVLVVVAFLVATAIWNALIREVREQFDGLKFEVPR